MHFSRTAAPQRPLRRTGRSSLAVTAMSALLVAAAGAPASAAPAAMTLSSPAGPSGGGNMVVGTLTGAGVKATTFPAGTLPTVQFQYVGGPVSGCAAIAQEMAEISAEGAVATGGVVQVSPLDVRRISGTRIAFKVPSTDYLGNGVNTGGLVLTEDQITAKWNVCVYDSDSTANSSLLAASTYTLVRRPTITSIVPASSPASGGQTITVNGTGFTAVNTPITASIGDVPLTDIEVAPNGASFTATTGPRAAGSGLLLTVTTAGGSVNSIDPDNDINTNDNPITFEYSNGVRVLPNTAPAGSVLTVYLTGVGFSQLTFVAGPPTSNNAHIFLVAGAYDAANNRGVAECRDVTVLNDTELVCTLNLAGNRLSPTTSAPLPNTTIADNAYLLTVVSDGGLGAGSGPGSQANPSVVSTGATFVVAPY